MTLNLSVLADMIGRATEDDMPAAARLILENMTEEQLLAVLNEVLDDEQKGELAASWEGERRYADQIKRRDKPK